MSTSDRLRTSARAARSTYRELRDRVSSGNVQARLRALEDEVQENRQLNRRIAELTDIVTELLIPLQDRDAEKVQALLAEYRARI